MTGCKDMPDGSDVDSVGSLALGVEVGLWVEGLRIKYIHVYIHTYIHTYTHTSTHTPRSKLLPKPAKAP